MVDPKYNSVSITNNSEFNTKNVPEQKNEFVSHTTVITDNLIFLRFSSFTLLQQTIAFCLRFINNTRINTKRKSSPLSIDKLPSSLIMILKVVQNNYFFKKKNIT